MNSSVMSQNLKQYIQLNYKDVKSDLFSAFIIKNSLLGKKNSYLGYMTPYVWMFISSYEELRKHIIKNMSISSLIQLEYSALKEATVPICTFVLQNSNIKQGTYIKLSEFVGGMDVQNKKMKESIEKDVDYKYIVSKDIFHKIPGIPIAFWCNTNLKKDFETGNLLESIIPVKKGADTGDNKKYLRIWFEVERKKIGYFKNKNTILDYEWAPYNKGGGYRKWYGNNDVIVNWKNNGEELKKSTANLRSKNLYFKTSITWSAITSSKSSFRYSNYGAIFDSAGSSMFPDKELNYYLGLCNSIVSEYILNIINPTLNFGAGSIGKIPIIKESYEKIDGIVQKNVMMSKKEWDSFETSWDFKKHPLINMGISLFDPETKQKEELLSNNFNYWNQICSDWFNKLKQNEEELNRIFIDIYGLQDELTAEIEDKDITIRKADRTREIKSLISYAVGCMFGRYSLDEDGLIYAGGEFDSSKYKTFNADTDNIIPITDEAYFNDDMVTRFKKFIEVVYGKETLYENLEYVAETLGKRGTETSEDTIRRYFVNDFYNDHVKTYKKRPIYWLFDSGKKNGFKCVIYMHRYSNDLVASIRTKYIPKVQTTYDKLLSDVEYKLSTDLSLTDKKEMEKKKIELNSKIQEVKEYYEKIAYVANKMIDIDLDDGVVVNYVKFTYLNPKTNKEEIILGNTK
ncbi:MAG: BREX-1 system adenine-specific DNA-methyltransferase PglX, partial [Clostridia bacterium]